MTDHESSQPRAQRSEARLRAWSAQQTRWPRVLGVCDGLTHVATLDRLITAPERDHQRFVGKDGHEARNPSAFARDFWVIPSGAPVTLIADGGDSYLLTMKSPLDDFNLYLYNNPVPGDWTYWDAISRNPSPVARDFWIIPAGNDAVAMAGIHWIIGRRQKLAAEAAGQGGPGDEGEGTAAESGSEPAGAEDS